jgi:hypothetical protein
MSFDSILKEVVALHDKKSKDYGRPTDPYYNIRGSEDFGIPSWVGAVMRANDKMKRLQVAASGKALANESVEDSLLDMITYLTIALDVYRTYNFKYTSMCATCGEQFGSDTREHLLDLEDLHDCAKDGIEGK